MAVHKQTMVSHTALLSSSLLPCPTVVPRISSRIVQATLRTFKFPIGLCVCVCVCVTYVQSRLSRAGNVGLQSAATRALLFGRRSRVSSYLSVSALRWPASLPVNSWMHALAPRHCPIFQSHFLIVSIFSQFHGARRELAKRSRLRPPRLRDQRSRTRRIFLFTKAAVAEAVGVLCSKICSTFWFGKGRDAQWATPARAPRTAADPIHTACDSAAAERMARRQSG